MCVALQCCRASLHNIYIIIAREHLSQEVENSNRTQDKHPCQQCR